MSHPPIWPNGIEIKFLGLAGESDAGKTMFGAMIDPANTLIRDYEQTAGVYQTGLGFTRIDVPAVMRQRVSNRYKEIQKFEWWLESNRDIKHGQYSVIMDDPIEDLGPGLKAYMGSLHSEYGFKSADSFENMKGIFWGEARAFYKKELLALADKCQTFVFTNHMNYVWINKVCTTKREPKGLETLKELASVYLVLNRKLDQQGKKPRRPNAIVLQSRLANFITTDGKIDPIAILPAAFTDATPDAIRAYILKPADPNTKKKSEKVPAEPPMSEDERAVLAHDTAVAQKEASQAETEANETALARLNRQATRQAELTATANKAAPATPAAKPPATPAKKPVKSKLRVAPADPTSKRDDEPCGTFWSDEVVRLMYELKFSRGKAVKILTYFGAKKIPELTQGQAIRLVETLKAKLLKQRTAAMLNSPAPVSEEDIPF